MTSLWLLLQCSIISAEKLQWKLKEYIMSWYHITTYKTYSVEVCNSMGSIQNTKYMFLFLWSPCSLLTSIFFEKIFWFDHISIVLLLSLAEVSKANPVIITICTYSQGEHSFTSLHLCNAEWLLFPKSCFICWGLGIHSIMILLFLVSVDFRAWLYVFLCVHSGFFY